MVSCVFCSREVDPAASGTFSKHLGWTFGNAGNTITLKGPALEYACGACIDLQEYERKRSHYRKAPENPQTCDLCGAGLEGITDYYVKRLCWAVKRTKGGNNRVVLPSEPFGYAHTRCIKAEKRQGKIVHEQESLF